MVVKHIVQDGVLEAELNQAGSKLVVVDFFATWCGPCQRIAPTFEQLSERNPQVVFLKVDVDKCPATAGSHGVTAMPTFLFFVSRSKVDTLRGADPNQLEQKINQWVERTSSTDGQTDVVPGQLDLQGFISKKDMECLNESDSYTLSHLFDGISHLESDCDEQLIVSLPFNQPVKLHSLVVKGTAESGPKNIKIFINQPNTLDFDRASGMEGTQAIELTEEQVTQGEVINLRYVKYQNVQDVQIFIQDNLTDTDVTQISSLKLYGTPINATNMQDFKRVAGKKGEAHA